MSRVQQRKQLRAAGKTQLATKARPVGTLAADRHRANPHNRISVAQGGTTYLPIVGHDKLGNPILGPESTRRTRPWKPTEYNGQFFGMNTPARFANSHI